MFSRLSLMFIVLSLTMMTLFACGKELTEEQIFSEAKKHYGQARYDEALKLYDELIIKYPESLNAPDAVFMSGYIYANQLKQFDKAKEYYTMFLEKFPDHDLASAANFEMEVLGVDSETMDKVLQERIDSLSTKK